MAAFWEFVDVSGAVQPHWASDGSGFITDLRASVDFDPMRWLRTEGVTNTWKNPEHPTKGLPVNSLSLR